MFEKIVLGGNGSLFREKCIHVKVDAFDMEEVEKKFDVPLDIDPNMSYNMVVFGGTNSSGAALKIASQCNVQNVLYIIPDQEFPPASKKQKLQHRIAFNILQQYSISGKFNLILLQNSFFEKNFSEKAQFVNEIYNLWNQPLESIVGNIEFVLSTLKKESNEEKKWIMSLDIILDEERTKQEQLFPLTEVKEQKLFIFGQNHFFKNKRRLKEVIDQVDDYEVIFVDNNFSLLIKKTDRIQADPIK